MEIDHVKAELIEAQIAFASNNARKLQLERELKVAVEEVLNTKMELEEARAKSAQLMSALEDSRKELQVTWNMPTTDNRMEPATCKTLSLDARF